MSIFFRREGYRPGMGKGKNNRFFINDLDLTEYNDDGVGTSDKRMYDVYGWAKVGPQEMNV